MNESKKFSMYDKQTIVSKSFCSSKIQVGRVEESMIIDHEVSGNFTEIPSRVWHFRNHKLSLCIEKSLNFIFSLKETPSLNLTSISNEHLAYTQLQKHHRHHLMPVLQLYEIMIDKGVHIFVKEPFQCSLEERLVNGGMGVEDTIGWEFLRE